MSNAFIAVKDYTEELHRRHSYRYVKGHIHHIIVFFFFPAQQQQQEQQRGDSHFILQFKHFS